MHSVYKTQSGKGLLLGGVPGVRRGRVAIIGGGVVGVNAAKMAIGLGARVTILDINAGDFTRRYLRNNVDTLMSNPENIEKAVAESDLVVGAVLIPGAKAPKLVTREMISNMEKGSVVVDVAIDQGGCIETILPTTQTNQHMLKKMLFTMVLQIFLVTFQKLPYALTNVTFRYALELANKGLESFK